VHSPQLAAGLASEYDKEQFFTLRYPAVLPQGSSQGGVMPYYVVLTALTDKGRKTIKEHPERILEVNRELEKMGIRVKDQYALLGPYDFVNIIEAPDNESVLKASIEIGSRGSAHPLTLVAIPVSDLLKKQKKSK